MIIDIAQFKKQSKNVQSPMWFSPVCTPQHWHLTNEQKEVIIAKIMESQEGRDALAASMVEPIRRHMDYAGIGRKLLMVDELPQGALARYERDVAAVAKACIAKRDIKAYELVSDKDISRID